MSVFGKVAHQRWLVVIAASLVVGTSAFALPLNPGENQWYTHAQVTGVPPYQIGPVDTGGSPGDWVLLASLNNVAHVGQLQGTTTSRVYRNVNTGMLAFSYITEADVANSRYIVRATLDGLGWGSTAITNAGADTSAGSSGTGLVVPEWTNGAPIFIARPEYSPTAPEWQFQIPRVPVLPNDPSIGTVIGPNNRSAEVWFVTNATAYTTGFIGYLDSGSTGRAEVLSPVPDPASLALLGMATGGLALIRRRRPA
jgi:hypothetical protein